MKRYIIAAILILGTCSTAAAQTDQELLDIVQEAAFGFFWNEADTTTGLIRDRSQSGSPCSIASSGFGFSAICIGIERGWITREEGRTRTLRALETYWNAPQGFGTTGTSGYKGLFYHFLDMNTATRAWNSELSTIDTALLLAGMLDAMEFFDGTHADEVQIRALVDSIYRRVDWEFVRNFTAGIHLGWKPETGFSGYGLWKGYNEAMIMYILALGSPTHAVPNFTWNTWTSTYQWQTHYGQSYVNFPPLFGHQYSHCWIDFRLAKDSYMTSQGIDYFENSRRATLAQRAYSIANPLAHAGYSDSLWGITASDYPGGYIARGAPPAQNDDGTIAPTAPIGSLPFAPDEVMPVIRNMYDNYPLLWGPYGFRDAFNLNVNWYGPDYVGIDQGPIVIMIENYRTGSTWKRMMGNPYILDGLTDAGFTAIVSVDDPQSSMPGLELAPAQPNPFGERTLLRFNVAQRGKVRLSVFDVHGRLVSTLVDQVMEAGGHTATLNGEGLSPGVYVYVLESGGEVNARRVVRLR
jgi:hypothetical protein